MADGGDEAAQAFEDLRAEMTLVRRAVERLTAERTELPDGPDYSETLGVISHTGKPQPKVTTAIARELVGYAWDIARHVSPAVAG